VSRVCECGRCGSVEGMYICGVCVSVEDMFFCVGGGWWVRESGL